MSTSKTAQVAPIQDVITHVRRAIDEIRAGRMVIVVDDEDRENEGDLTMAADMVTAEAINFMVTHGRGLICLALTEEHIEQLRLPMMHAMGHGRPALGTAFTVSIEARYGVTTGISAADRAQTIRVASRPNAKPEDLLTPGHVFPLRARRGGVLVRTGQTEGAVDLARAAGMTPAGVICEIMNDDGTMARGADLERFAARHDMMIVSIAQLIQYRTQTERLMRLLASGPLPVDETASEWQGYVYESVVDQERFLALVKGNPAQATEPVLCRVHRGSIVGDVFSSAASEAGRDLRMALRLIERQGCGVVLYMPSQGDVLREFQAYQTVLLKRSTSGAVVDNERDTVSAVGSAEGSAEGLGEIEALQSRGYGNEGPLREFGLGAQVLADLGLRRIIVLTDNPRRIVGIGGFGIEVVGSAPLHERQHDDQQDGGVHNDKCAPSSPLGRGQSTRIKVS